MRKTNVLILTLIAVITLVFSMSCVSADGGGAASGEVVVQAEKFTEQEGGKTQFMDDRVASDRCIAYWDAEGHNLMWEVNIPKDGDYKIVLRYCHGRKALVYRSFLVDGAAPVPTLAKFGLMPTGGWGKTGNDWANYTILDEAGNPVIITLTAGTHTIKMENLGADAGERASVNFDGFGIFTPDADPNILGVPGVELE
ncbi:MAG: hypothetical protein JW904_04110 [Spirochaetales bacterium]|nr:hypothetical protein [Spirochaetales bacterium]